MSIFTKIGAWFAKAFKNLKTDGAKVAVAITGDIQAALNTGAIAGLASVISSLFPSVKGLPEEILAQLQKEIPKLLAAELAIQGLPDDATPEQVLAFEAAVLNAFGVHDKKSKLYTTLAAQIYDIIQQHHGAVWTFADLVQAVEAAYQEYMQDIKDAEAES